VDRSFQFQERCQFFISVHDETLSVAAMRVGNENVSTPLMRFE
jgi:hypothetical protein